MVEIHKINPLWYLTGRGNMLLQDEGLSMISQNVFSHDLNLLVPAGGRPGYVAGWSHKYIDEHVQCLKVPGVSGRAITVEVEEGYMSPELAPGDWISCTPADQEDVIDGKIYALVGPGFFIGYARATAQVVSLAGISQDSPEYKVPFSEIRELWEAQVVISSRLPVAQGEPGQLAQRIQAIEEFLKIHHENWTGNQGC